MRKLLFHLGWLLPAVILIWFSGGCAQIGMPTGGARDSLAPVIVRTNPPMGATNFRGRVITFQFDEYIELQDLQNNFSYTPFQNQSPVVSYNLRTVTVRLRDSLKPNTTYFINLGNSVRDINEGNIYPDLGIAFSTGDVLDTLNLRGSVSLAETGGTDSTMVAMLYRNAHDTAVRSRKPDYLSRIRGDGSFSFSYLPSGNYRVYALKDGDRDRTYNSKREMFGFLDSIIILPGNETAVQLYAYQEESAPVPPAPGSRIFTYTTEAGKDLQDILSPLSITFSRPLSNVNEEQFSIKDSSGNETEGKVFNLDSSRMKLDIEVPWREATTYTLTFSASAVQDTSGADLQKGDTISFQTRSQNDYGTVLARFRGLDLSMNPVLQVWNGNVLVKSYPLSSPEWNSGMFIPGEYTLRILFDRNGNGTWDTGNYEWKLQPEIVIPVQQKITVRANFDNEVMIEL